MARRKIQRDTSTILGIEKTRTRTLPRCSPNVLPCRIHHDGPVNASKRYWNPTADADGTQTSYFRGRKLKGRTLHIPSSYIGVVLQRTDRTHIDTFRRDEAIADLESKRHDMEEEEYEAEREDFQASLRGFDSGTEEIQLMEEVAKFDAITSWGHEILPDEVDDPYVRGIEEWVKFASAIHAHKPANDTSVA